MRSETFLICLLYLLSLIQVQAQQSPEQIYFIRQASRRFVFDDRQSITLASLRPESVVGIDVMHPMKFYSQTRADISLKDGNLIVSAGSPTESAIWLGGFNPFATYLIDIDSYIGEAQVGLEISDSNGFERIQIFEVLSENGISDVRFKMIRGNEAVADTSIALSGRSKISSKHQLIIQMLGSGLVVYVKSDGLPQVIGQFDFNKYADLRDKKYPRKFHSNLFAGVNGMLNIEKADIALTSGSGLADIRPITYENGEPIMDQNELWFTMSVRGRALPHHLQGIFSLNPTTFDIKFRGIVVFDRKDGLLRNEIASHLFYDRKEKLWRGVTTGFSAYANPEKEKKQLLIIESKQDPRFGFSVMEARPFNMVGDIEDPQILYDTKAKKWRMVACKSEGGYKAVLFESKRWDQGYRQIAGPVKHNSTGTSIQRINGKLYCFSGSSENKLFVYSYPELKEIGTLNIDLPPWNKTSGSRVWPNVIQLPEGFPFKYIALMMDRFNYPGIQGPNWTYGALYYYHGYDR